MAALGSLGVVSLNGVTLGPETWTLGASIRPIPDSSGRTIVANLYTFIIKTILVRSQLLVASDIFLGLTPANDDVLEIVRRLLMTYGGQFYYQRKGFGAFAINVAGGQPDMEWGPKIEEINWKPIGGGIAAELTFRVSFKILDCSTYLAAFNIMEFCYTAEFEIGRDRLTAWTYSGFYRIPQTRGGDPDNRFLFDTADTKVPRGQGLPYYELFIPPVAEGWRREREWRKISEDKCREDFSIRDQMLKAPLDLGCTDMDTWHEQHNDPPVQMNVKTGRIGAWYDIALDHELSIGQIHFNNMWKEKIDWLQNNGNIVVMQNYYATENYQQRRVQFEVSYRLFRPAGLEGFGFLPVRGPQGFYRALPNAGHGIWLNNPGGGGMNQKAYLPRGYDQSSVEPQDDLITDLCSYLAVKNTAAKTWLVPGSLAPDEALFNQECPDPEYSWIWWQCWDEYSPDDGVSMHKALPTSPKSSPAPSSLGVEWAKKAFGFQPVDPGKVTLGEPNSIKAQQRTSPTIYKWLVGYAVRLCYDIPEPILVDVNGAPAIQANRPEIEYFRTRTLGNIGLPIRIATWRRRYIVNETGPNNATPVTPIPNPVIPDHPIQIEDHE